VAFDAQPALLMEAVKTRDKQQLLERLHVIHDGSRDNPQVPAARPSQLSETSVIERGGPLRGAQPMPVMVSARSNELERKLREARELAEWHLRVSAILLAFPKRWLWRFAPLRWRRKRLLELLQREGLFDGSAYLERYPDGRSGHGPVFPLSVARPHGRACALNFMQWHCGFQGVILLKIIE
jgi:hypothetical protein